MGFRRAFIITGLVVSLCQLSAPAMAQEASGTPATASSPASSRLVLSLRGDVTPGRYQLAAVDGQAPPAWHPAAVSGSETVETHPSHRGRAITGAALLATGVALVVVGTSAFVYGAVSNLETMECDTACGGVSSNFLRMSAAGAGLGLVFAVVGGVLAYSASGS